MLLFFLSLLLLIPYISLYIILCGCKIKSVFGFSIFNKQGCSTGVESVHETFIKSLVWKQSLHSVYGKFSAIWGEPSFSLSLPSSNPSAQAEPHLVEKRLDMCGFFSAQRTSQASSSDMSIDRVVISNAFHFEEGKQWYLIFRDCQKQNSSVYAALNLLLQIVLESL